MSDKGVSDKGSNNNGLESLNSNYLSKVYLFHILLISPILIYLGFINKNKNYLKYSLLFLGGFALVYHGGSLLYSKQTDNWNWGAVNDDKKNKGWLTNVYYLHIVIAGLLLYYYYYFSKNNNQGILYNKYLGAIAMIGIFSLIYHSRMLYQGVMNNKWNVF